MEGNDELKEIGIKNRTCYYFDYIMRVSDSDFDILIYDISYKTFMDVKPLYIRFDKINEFIKTYDGSRYLVLFGPERYNAIYDKIRYL